MFEDDSEELAPSPLQVAAAMFKSKSKSSSAGAGGASANARLAQPLHLPKMEVPTWYIYTNPYLNVNLRG